MMSADDKQEPPPYDQASAGYTHTTTTTTTTTEYTSSTPSGGDRRIFFNKGFFLAKEGILMIIESVVSLIALICASVANSWSAADDLAEFVAGSAFVCTLIWFILHLINVSSYFHPVMTIIMLVYMAVFAVLSLIAAIVCAAFATGAPALGACAFFEFVATGAFGVDVFFRLRDWRSGGGSTARSRTTNTQSEEVRY